MGAKQVERCVLSRGPKYAAMEFNSTDEADFRYETQAADIFSSLGFVTFKLAVSPL